MDTNKLFIGHELIARNDRIMRFEGHPDLVIWRKGQTLKLQGVIQHEHYREFLIDLGGTNWENVPEPLMPDLFSLPQTH